MSSFGISSNPLIEQVATVSAVASTWTSTRGTISKLLIGQQSGAASAYTVAYAVAGTAGTAFRAQAAGTTFAVDGVNWKDARIEILQSSGGDLPFYVESWS